MIAKKSDGSQAKEKESTDSSTTIEDDDVKGKLRLFNLNFSKRIHSKGKLLSAQNDLIKHFRKLFIVVSVKLKRKKQLYEFLF